jgi:putative RNA 2'-phosphotransferase
MEMSNLKLGKRIAYVLRHNPASVNIELDAGGWVDVETFASALQVSVDSVMAVCETDNKGRYVIRDGRIRATQGHSFPVELQLSKPEIIPETLFHGTVVAVLAEIMQTGLKPMLRQYVHLSESVSTATQVGSRRQGTLILLRIDTATVTASGGVFWLSENGVWLTDSVPAEAITVLTTS